MKDRKGDDDGMKDQPEEDTTLERESRVYDWRKDPNLPAHW